MPVVPSTENLQSHLNAPRRIRNSPTKPFKRGSPIEDRVANIKNSASTGITLAIPPNSAIFFVCLLSYTMPTIRNNAPVDRP